MRRSIFMTALLAFIVSCGGNVDRKFIYKKPEVIVLDSYVGRYLVDYDSVYYSNLTIRTNMSHDTYTASAGFYWGNRAYAAHKESRYLPMEKIKNVKLITMYDYNAQFPAGSDMADSCVFKEGNTHHTRASLVDRMNQGDDRYSGYGIAGIVDQLDISLKVAPTTKSLQAFAIIFETTTPSQFGDTTIVFNIKP